MRSEPTSGTYQPSDSPGVALIQFRWRVVQEALETKPRSFERGVELRRAFRKWGVPIRTMQRWITKFEATGGDINSLNRSSRNDLASRRVWVSRTFDREFLKAFDPALLPSLQAKVDQLIRAAWSSPAQRAGWKQVRREVVTAFQRHLHNMRIHMPEAAITISQRRVREARYFRIVDVRAHDRKTYDDQLPRIRRSNEVLVAMQQIVMDVKVVDCAVTRADGSVAWPRMIAFMDTATQRVFRRFFLLEPSQSIRQEHVAVTFLEMASDPMWGFPQQLYRDNGSEFFILDMIRGALAELQDQNIRTIINARPYSAASKPIESKFASLDRFVFSQMAGWTGGDRMRNKTAHLGQPPAPYPGSFEEFAQEADDRMRVFENEPISTGPFAGKTPQKLLRENIDRGWRPLLVPVDRIDAAFCTRDTRRVSRGKLKIAGAIYRHPNLVNGRTLTVARPWRRGASPLVLFPETGWAPLELDTLFAPDDYAGVQASDRRRREHDAAVRQLKKSAGHIDLQKNHRDRLAAASQASLVEPIFDKAALPNEASLGQAIRVQLDQGGACERNDSPRDLSDTEELEHYLATRRRATR